MASSGMSRIVAVVRSFLQQPHGVTPVKYEQGFYIAEDASLHSHRRENLKSYIALTGWAL
jgi:hypothetical protein